MNRHLIAAGTEHYLAAFGKALPQVPGELATIVSLFTRFGYTERLTHLRLDPGAQALQTGIGEWMNHDARDEQDVAVVYYTGHGFTNGGIHYLAATDTNPKLVNTAVQSDVFIRLLGTEPRVRHLLVILDVCYAGTGLFDAVDVARRMSPHMVPWERGEGVWILAASRPRQAAQQGAFAAAFAGAIDELGRSTGRTQRFLSFDALIEKVNDRLGGRQQAGYAPAGLATGLPPFIPNPNFEATAKPGEDLESARLRARHVRAHWDPKSRGVDVAGQAGWYFTGREAALRRLLDWLAQPGADARPRVVTGQPGAGKSALLGHLYLRCHPELRPNAEPAPGPAPARVDSAIVARGMTDAGILVELAADLGCPGVEVDELGAFVAARGEPRNVILDALDEAEDPGAVVQRVLLPLLEASAGQLRLVIGTRRDELAGLRAEYALIDLDAPEFYAPRDVVEYVAAVLLAADDAQSGSPYRGDAPAARAAGEAVAGRAHGSFLIARVAARTLARGAHVLSEAEIAEAGKLWEAVGTAFDQDLARYGNDQDKVRDLLAPLAFARGLGLPWETLWAPIATALAGGFTRYTDDDVRWVQAHAGAYIVEAVDDDRAAYRLVHRELGAHLRRRHERATAEGQIVDALLERVPTDREGRRDWLAAHRYIRRHLATHAAAAGRIDELIVDAGFLIAAEPSRLARAGRRASSEQAVAAAAAHLLAAEHLRGGTPAQRAAALGLAARQRGQAQLAAGADAVLQDGWWRARWADWTGFDPHLTLTRMSARVQAIAPLVVGGRACVAVGAVFGGLCVIDADTGETLAEFDLGSSVAALAAVSVRGEPLLLVGTSDGALHTVQPAGWRHTSLPAHESSLSTISAGFLGGEPAVVTGGSGGDAPGSGSTVRIWRAGTADVPAWTPASAVHHAFDGTIRGAHLVTLDGDDVLVIAGDAYREPKDRGDMIRLLDPATGALIRALDTGRTGYIDIALAPDGTLLSHQFEHATQSRLRRWDLATGAVVAEATGGYTPSFALSVVQVKGETAVAAMTDSGIELRHVSSLQPLGGWRPIVASDVVATCPVELGARSLLASGGEGGAVRLWDLGWRLTTGGPVRHQPSTRAVAAVRTGRRSWALAAGRTSHQAYDLADGSPRQLTQWPDDAHVTAIAVAGPVAFLGCDDGHLRWMDLDAGTTGTSQEHHQYAVRAVAAWHDGRRLLVATAGDDRRVRLWDGASGSALTEPLTDDAFPDKPLHAVALARTEGSAAVIATGSSWEFAAWDIDVLLGGPPEIARVWASSIAMPEAHGDLVRDLAVWHDPGGDILYSVGDDALLAGTDLARNVVDRRRANAHSGWVTAVCAAEVDGRQLVVTGGKDGMVKVWGHAPDLPLIAEIPLDAYVTSLAADELLLVGTAAGVAAIDLSGVAGRDR